MSRKARVLIVDDEVLNLRLFERAFGKEFELVALSSPADALARATEGAFDILFVDFFMPEVNGVALVRELRASGVDATVVIVTGNEMHPQITDARDAGLIAGIIPKPWDRKTIREWVMRSVRASESKPGGP